MKAQVTSSARSKVLQTAYQLFYSQGYNSTTVDQIIEKSGVSKPTVYSHFPSKEDLCVEYLKERRSHESELLRGRLRKFNDPLDKFFAIIEFVHDRTIAGDYRGCPFFNMVSEIADFSSPIVKEAKTFVDGFNELILQIVKELKASHKQYSKLDATQTTRAYYVIVCGAIMAAQELQEEWPFIIARKQVENLLK